MKKSLLVIFIFLIYHLGYSQELDSLSDNKPAQNFKFGLRLGVQSSFFDFGENEFFDITEQSQIGGSFGFTLDWRISDYNRIRVEPYYMYQPLLNSYNEDGNLVEAELINHVPGLDFFPIVLTYGGKIKGTISAGGFYRYKILGSSTVKINGEVSSQVIEGYSNNNYGFVVGGGVYLGRKLLELRIYKSLIDSYTDLGFQNRVTDFSLIFTL